MVRTVLVFIVLISGWAQCLDAQNFKKNARFKAGIVMGFNAAQIDGDDQLGYRQIGIGAGLRGVAMITPTIHLSFELLFSQKGSKPSPQTESLNALTFDLTYAEVPVLLNILGKESWDEFRPLHFQVGASFSRLLNSKIKEAANRPLKAMEIPYRSLEEELSSNEVAIILGVTYYFSKHFGMGIRHSYAVTPLFNTDNYPDITNNTLRSYHLNAQAVYIF